MKKKGDGWKEQGKRGESINARNISLSQGKKQCFLRQNFTLEYLQFPSNLKGQTLYGKNWSLADLKGR